MKEKAEQIYKYRAALFDTWNISVTVAKFYLDIIDEVHHASVNVPSGSRHFQRRRLLCFQDVPGTRGAAVDQHRRKYDGNHSKRPETPTQIRAGRGPNPHLHADEEGEQTQRSGAGDEGHALTLSFWQDSYGRYLKSPVFKETLKTAACPEEHKFT